MTEAGAVAQDQGTLDQATAGQATAGQGTLDQATAGQETGEPDADQRTRIEVDSLGEVAVPIEALWGAQTQRAMEHFAIGTERFAPELISAYALVKLAAARVNRAEGRLTEEQGRLIVQACEEILAGEHRDMFPLHVWMSGSGTPMNMNLNEVIANRCSQLAGTPLGSKVPVHPNDHVNLAQSTNDSFPTAVHVMAALGVTERLLPAAHELHDAVARKAALWDDIVKIGRTHLQDATPLTLGQEWSGYAAALADGIERIEHAQHGVLRLALGGTAVGTGINAPQGFDQAVALRLAQLTGLPFVTAPNKFAVQSGHDALVGVSGVLRTLATTLLRIANDIRLLASGPRSGLAELVLPANEPGSSIMPGKVNPTQVEALSMVCVQVIGNDTAMAMAGAGGFLQMNAYKPLMAHLLAQSIALLADAMTSFRVFLIEGTEPNRPQIARHVERSLMLVTALAPEIGYDRAAAIAHHALHHDVTLREAALESGVGAEQFDRVVDPRAMLGRPAG